MRHLRVPSAETQDWLALCKASDWLLSTSGVVALEDSFRAIPLRSDAPDEADPCWKGLVHVEVESKGRGPLHWTERLPSQLQALPAETWPAAYEIQGDVLIVKLEDSAAIHASAIASAMLEQLPNVRLVCADDGVEGDFRVRRLTVLGSRDGTKHTRTRVREHGHLVWVDPGKVYFSSRLSNERNRTLESLKELRSLRNQPLVVADPYAGVGPAFSTLFSEPGLLNGCLAGDLNPDAVDLLRLNLEQWSRKRTDGPLSNIEVVCMDALDWKERPELCAQADVVLVNLPHDSFEHLPSMFPLLRKGVPVMIRGWAIRERAFIDTDRNALRALLEKHAARNIGVELSEIKGFSSTKCFVAFECHLTI